MGKHGPCYHCGVTSTPLWRNGPPEKPVLCNACGSRWRTKGTLANYTPLHSRAEPDELEDLRFSRVKSVSIKNKESKVLKRKLNSVEIAEFGVIPPNHNQVLHKVFDEDTSNRSSSGSAISNSEKYTQYGIADTSDLTSPPQPSAWDTMVPSRKRTCVARQKPSPVEALTKDLYTLWYEQQSSCLSGSSEEDLLLESDKPMVSVEIGHGSVLIRHPTSVVREEESEASSLSVDKQYTLNSRLMSFPGFIEDRGAYSSSKANEKIKKNVYPGAILEQTRRDKEQVVKLPILAHHNSPLCDIDLQDIVNFEMFSRHLTYDEQQKLMKLLPSVDTSDAPYSLSSMFGSTEFNLNLLSFQKLIAEGVFDNSFGGLNKEDGRILKRLVLCDFAKSKWVERHAALKDLKGKSSITSSEVVGGYNGFEIVTGANVKRSRDGHHQKNTGGSKEMMKSPRRIVMKSSYSEKECIYKSDSFMSAKSLFSVQNDNGSSSVLDTSHFEGENSDQDLLLDVPSNASFPQAELLPRSSFGALASTSSSSVHPNLVRP